MTADDRTTRGVLRPGLRFGLSLGLLSLLAWQLDLAEMTARLRQMEMAWVVAALVLSVVQVVVSGWRWKFTATRLGVALPLREAIREYYLAMFLNQVLPGGVLGDVSRAWRHASARQRVAAPAGPAVGAVVLERLSGQIVMTGLAVASLASLVMGRGLLVWAVVLILSVATVWVFASRASWNADREPATVGARVWRDAKTALLASAAFPMQMASSTVVVASYVATYLMAAMAVGVETPAATLLPLVAPVLVTMLFPVSVAGWGVREAAAAVVWSAVGLSTEDGVVISVAYGLLVFGSSLPGCLVLLGGRTPEARFPEPEA